MKNYNMIKLLLTQHKDKLLTELTTSTENKKRSLEMVRKKFLFTNVLFFFLPQTKRVGTTKQLQTISKRWRINPTRLKKPAYNGRNQTLEILSSDHDTYSWRRTYEINGCHKITKTKIIYRQNAKILLDKEGHNLL